MQRATKGINLGGWLVIEKWMTPSLFSGTAARNEFELAASKQGRDRIKKHHREFITEDDLVWMKKQGIETLRVPFGYWIFGDDERYVAAIDRLDWLVATSLSYGFKLLLDLHAAPEAQNYAAHSGSGNTIPNNYSTKWLNNKNAQDRTIEVLCKIAKRYHDSPSVWGIQLINEPAIDLLGLKLVRFYRKAYRALTKVARPGTTIVFSDAYAPLLTTNCFGLRVAKNYPVAMDCHIYQVFGKKSQKRTFNQVIKRTWLINLFIRFLQLQQPVIIGEWSAMLPFRVSDDKIKQYVESQQQAFAPVQAIFFWNYKTESPGRWNYRDLRSKELIQ